MTAVIIRFKSSIDIVTNSTVAEIRTAKRSVSPPVTTEENIIQEDTTKSCKRLKTETTM